MKAFFCFDIERMFRYQKDSFDIERILRYRSMTFIIVDIPSQFAFINLSGTFLFWDIPLLICTKHFYKLLMKLVELEPEPTGADLLWSELGAGADLHRVHNTLNPCNSTKVTIKSVMWIRICWICIVEGWLDPDPYGEIRIRIQEI